jgi:regulator of protease activity HflC (stomatin/prohibitin superfamily)
MRNFPYPEKPDDWQTAYTRDQAHHDSEKYGNNFSAPLLLGFLVALAYACFCAARFFLSGAYPLLLLGPLAILIVLLPLLFFGLMLNGAFRLASNFLVEFYQPPEELDPSKIINNRLFGKSKLPPPLNMFSQFKYILAKDGEIANPDHWPAWSACNLGGPIMPIVFDGCALYLERGNRFSRVVGPGHQVPFLEWFETIKYVVDLRPKVKEAGFDVWTKDGIKVKFSIKIECRIGDPAKHDPASSLMYPYDPQAVKKAIERYALRWPKRFEGEPEEFTWVDAAWGQVTGIVPSYVGSRMLDDLFIADRMRGQILSPEAIKEIFEKLNKATNGFGVFITDFQILKIEIPKEVEDRQKDRWKAERQSIATIVEGKAKALSIRTQQKARADAQRDLILAIADGLEKNINRDENEGDKERFIEPLLLSFSGVLDESLRNPLLRANLAKDTLEVLEKLQNMLEKPSS